MAYGAITQQNVAPGGSPSVLFDGNGLQLKVVNVVGDSSYVAGGRSLTAQQLGFQDAVIFGQAEIYDASATATGVVVSVQPQSDGSVKLKCLTNTLTEAAAAPCQATVTYQLMLWGY